MMFSRNKGRAGLSQRRSPQRKQQQRRLPASATKQRAEPSDQASKKPRLAALNQQGTTRLLLGLLVALLLLYLLALAVLRPASPGEKVTLDRVTRLAVCAQPPKQPPDPQMTVYCDGVDQVISEARFLDQDSRITGTIVPKGGPGPEQKFWTSYPNSGAATNDLLRNLNAGNTRVTVETQGFKALVRFVAQFLLPLVVLADLFALLFLLIQGDQGGSPFLSFGRAGDRRQRKEKERVTFANVAAADEAVTELAEVRDYLADPSSFVNMGALPPKGVLLFGPPGCGKTLLARAVAGEVKGNFFSMGGAEFVEALVGIGAARVRDLFAQARANAPAVIFIDEIDAVGRQRGAGFGQGHDEREQTLNELLAQIDGFSPTEAVVVIAATNRPDILDPALLRAGRFDRHVTLERPDFEGRLEILRLHARGRRLQDTDGALVQAARDTPGFTGADLANVLNEAALLAVRERASAISPSHIAEAVERVMAGPKRRSRIISDEEKRTLAYHESGHAVVASALGKGHAIRKLSIIARGPAMGHLGVLADGDHTIVHRGEMEAQIAIAMAGLAAEELVFGEPSSGSESDIERATTTARDMAGRYGMSVRLGPVRVLAQEKEIFLGRDYLSTRDISQPTLEHLDVEVRRIVEEQKEKAASILSSNRAALDGLATALFERETIQGSELEQALALPKKRAKATAGTKTTAGTKRT